MAPLFIFIELASNKRQTCVYVPWVDLFIYLFVKIVIFMIKVCFKINKNNTLNIREITFCM